MTTGLGMECAARLYVIPTLHWLAQSTGKGRLSSPQACAMLLAIGAQESGWCDRRQRPSGPARSCYQIETDTALAVLNKWEDGRRLWEDLFPKRSASPAHVREAVELSEVGATLIARGILWLDPHSLPTVEDAAEAEAWACYLRCWRPGKPRPELWSGNWRQAVETTLRWWS